MLTRFPKPFTTARPPRRSRILALATILGLCVPGSRLLAQPAAADSASTPSSTLIVHYHRSDASYDDATIWAWNAGSGSENSREVLPTGRDDFGALFSIDLAPFGGASAQRVGVITRKGHGWEHKDGGDRIWTPSLGREAWVAPGEGGLAKSRPDISPKISAALIDGTRQVRLSLTEAMAASQVAPEAFTVTGGGGASIPVVAAINNSTSDKTLSVSVMTGADLDFRHGGIVVKAKGYGEAPARAGKVIDELVTSEPMGMTYSPAKTSFRVFAPMAEKVSVVLYDARDGGTALRELACGDIGGGAWGVTVSDVDLAGKFYMLRVKNPGKGEAAEFVDPEATNTTGDGGRARITNVRADDPPGFRPVRRPSYGASPTDAVIYEIHVRDFTISPSSGVDPGKRGKYLGFAQPGTTLPGDASIKTGIDHLKELGVTHVQILPLEDYDNKEAKGSYNWGYVTDFFNSPEGSYSSNYRDDTKIKEYKQLIKALHDAGIGVVMDVVYNHVGNGNTFNATAPGYYFRLKDDGSNWNGSGCGNEVRTEGPMVRRFIINSCKYWVEEYGVDGFRFDLMGIMDLETMKQAKKELTALYPNILFYGEPWSGGASGLPRLTDKRAVKGTGIAAFNDDFRNALKGEPDSDAPGYIVNGGRRVEVMKGIAGSMDLWTASPVESINYGDAHDNLVLWDKLAKSAGKYSQDERKKMQMLSGGVLAVSQGIPFLHAGVELLRTKKGNNNSYDAGDDINEIDWNNKKAHRDVFDFYRGVIALRKAHPMFRLSSASESRQRARFANGQLPSKDCIAFTVNGAGLKGEAWKAAAVLINPTSQAQSFTSPLPGAAKVYVLGPRAGDKPFATATGAVSVPSHGMAVLAQD